MKKNKINLDVLRKTNLVLAILMLLTAASCSSSNKSGTTIPKIPEILGASISKKIISPNGKDTVESTLTYQFYATPQFPWQDSVNYAVGNFVWSSLESDETPYTYKPLSHQFFYERLDSFERNYLHYATEDDFFGVWDYQGETTIEDDLKNFVQMKQFFSIYTGGAHPNSYELLSVISKADGKTLLLKDLVVDVEKFNRIAEKYFLQARELTPADLLEDDFWFENKIFVCNDNFSITPKGIKFTFNPYEIAPYSFGITEFTVPMNKIKALLKVNLDPK